MESRDGESDNSPSDHLDDLEGGRSSVSTFMESSYSHETRGQPYSKPIPMGPVACPTPASPNSPQYHQQTQTVVASSAALADDICDGGLEGGRGSVTTPTESSNSEDIGIPDISYGKHITSSTIASPPQMPQRSRVPLLQFGVALENGSAAELNALNFAYSAYMRETSASATSTYDRNPEQHMNRSDTCATLLGYPVTATTIDVMQSEGINGKPAMQRDANASEQTSYYARTTRDDVQVFVHDGEVFAGVSSRRTCSNGTATSSGGSMNAHPPRSLAGYGRVSNPSCPPNVPRHPVSTTTSSHRTTASYETSRADAFELFSHDGEVYAGWSAVSNATGKSATQLHKGSPTPGLFSPSTTPNPVSSPPPAPPGHGATKRATCEWTAKCTGGRLDSRNFVPVEFPSTRAAHHYRPDVPLSSQALIPPSNAGPMVFETIDKPVATSDVASPPPRASEMHVERGDTISSTPDFPPVPRDRPLTKNDHEAGWAAHLLKESTAVRQMLVTETLAEPDKAIVSAGSPRTGWSGGGDGVVDDSRIPTADQHLLKSGEVVVPVTLKDRVDPEIRDAPTPPITLHYNPNWNRTMLPDGTYVEPWVPYPFVPSPNPPAAPYDDSGYRNWVKNGCIPYPVGPSAGASRASPNEMKNLPVLSSADTRSPSTNEIIGQKDETIDMSMFRKLNPDDRELVASLIATLVDDSKNVFTAGVARKALHGILNDPKPFNGRVMPSTTSASPIHFRPTCGNGSLDKSSAAIVPPIRTVTAADPISGRTSSARSTSSVTLYSEDSATTVTACCSPMSPRGVCGQSSFPQPVGYATVATERTGSTAGFQSSARSLQIDTAVDTCRSPTSDAATSGWWASLWRWNASKTAGAGDAKVIVADLGDAISLRYDTALRRYVRADETLVTPNVTSAPPSISLSSTTIKLGSSAPPPSAAIMPPMTAPPTTASFVPGTSLSTGPHPGAAVGGRAAKTRRGARGFYVDVLQTRGETALAPVVSVQSFVPVAANVLTYRGYALAAPAAKIGGAQEWCDDSMA
ncbi:hypothetical protein HK101_010461 [Irineochytrium annulatum]|nr:hypothetical protein HK101_010461 [Irineochytrium annulatum]